MLNRKDRKCKIDFDYKVFDDTGVKISKNRDFVNMSGNMLEEKKLLELQIFDDIKNIYDTNLLNEMETVEDLEEVLAEVSLLNKKFRHVHVELKYLMGEQYAESYADSYDTRLDGMRSYGSAVKQKIKLLNSSKINDEKEKLTSSLKIEEEVFRERVEKELLTFEMDEHSKIDEIKENCSKFEHLLEGYYNLLSKAKIGLGIDFQNTFNSIFDDTITRIRGKIDEGKVKIKKHRI